MRDQNSQIFQGLDSVKIKKDMLKIKEAFAALSLQSSRSAAQFGLALSLSLLKVTSSSFCLLVNVLTSTEVTCGLLETGGGGGGMEERGV